MGLTVAPVNAWFLAWVALAPLWVLVIPNPKSVLESWAGRKPTPPTFRQIQNSLAWGIGYHGTALHWITGMHPMTWLGVPWLLSLAIALFSWTFITLWGAALVTTWGLGMRLVCRSIPNGGLRVLIGTALWCALESLWSSGPLWWTSLSYTQSPHNLVILHLGQLTGPSAVTAAIVAVNGFLAEAWMNRQDAKDAKNSWLSWRPWRLNFTLALTLFITCHLIGFNLYNKPLVQPPESALKVGIIQGNVPNNIKFYTDGLRRALEGYTTGYEDLVAQGAQAVLTPEGALPYFQSRIKATSLGWAVRDNGVVAWIGGYGEKQGINYTNSLFTFTKDGEIFSRYDKAKLVPLGEYIPFEEVIGGLISRLSPLEAKQVPGNPKQIFDTPFGRAIAGICYESAFPEIFRYQAAQGGQFILTGANNDPYSAAMQAQHHAQDTMRAIETDRWAVRATNTGLSAFVDPHGKTVWISGHKTYEAHAETIYRRQTQTLYVRWGDWLTPLLLGLGAMVWCVKIFLQNDGKTKLNA
ncbi:MAG: apolipoprotein N-acyltransferase [Nostocaceae cyanobacterium]|nr:apolipoprotein N-acyltransferase [Nostocaceae cyanobacterium]